MADDTQTVGAYDAIEVQPGAEIMGEDIEALRHIYDWSLVLIARKELTAAEAEALRDDLPEAIPYSEMTHRGIVVARAKKVVEEVEAIAYELGFSFTRR